MDSKLFLVQPLAKISRKRWEYSLHIVKQNQCTNVVNSSKSVTVEFFEIAKTTLHQWDYLTHLRDEVCMSSFAQHNMLPFLIYDFKEKLKKNKPS